MFPEKFQQIAKTCFIYIKPLIFYSLINLEYDNFITHKHEYPVVNNLNNIKLFPFLYSLNTQYKLWILTKWMKQINKLRILAPAFSETYVLRE